MRVKGTLMFLKMGNPLWWIWHRGNLARHETCLVPVGSLEAFT